MSAYTCVIPMKFGILIGANPMYRSSRPIVKTQNWRYSLFIPWQFIPLHQISGMFQYNNWATAH